MNAKLYTWGEKYLFSPGIFELFLSYLLLPVSFLYCSVVWLKYKLARAHDFDIPVIGIGNLIVGGSGKTPLGVALAKKYTHPAIVLRGYGRQSTGLNVVSNGKSILCDVGISGDEAMLYATLLSHAIVVVCEKREQGIVKAKEMGAEIIFLDDAYSKHHIKKLDIVILSQQNNSFCLPSGPYRERLWKGKKVLGVEEGVDFRRKVEIGEKRSKMLLVTAISKPQRLEKYLDASVIDKVFFPDHYVFDKAELEALFEESGAESLLVTRKDAVKMEGFDIPLSFLELELDVDEKLHSRIAEYAKIPPKNEVE